MESRRSDAARRRCFLFVETRHYVLATGPAEKQLANRLYRTIRALSADQLGYVKRAELRGLRANYKAFYINGLCVAERESLELSA